jgi:heavy metal translocating P-type ATPase
MLITATGAGDPSQFRDTDLFKQCRDLGIIPASEADLMSGDQPPELPIAAAAADNDGAESSPFEDTAAAPNNLILQLRIDGMWCPACAWLIDASLKKTSGILSSGCNFSTDRLRCVYDPVRTSPDRIIAIIERLGYHATAPGEGGRAREQRRETIRFAVSAFLTMNVMMISFALYSGFFSSLSPDAVTKLSWPIFIMATVVMVYGGKFIFLKALAGFSNAAFSMETLIAIGAASAYFFSVYNLDRGNIHLYFDTASMLVALVLLGKLLERNAKEKVLEDLDAFFALKPTKVKICNRDNPEGRYVSAEYLRKDDLFLLDDGEIAPADGRVIDGDGLVDESSLTGEARPVPKRLGSAIRSGTKVSRGRFKVKALAVGDDSTLGQMMKIIEKTLGQKTAFEGKTDRLLNGFVPFIILLAVGTVIYGYLKGLDPGEALIRAVTVLVISCPCALGLAIPLARVAGISLCGREGILVRDYTAFEQARQVDTFIFDKTGTLTTGRWRLLDILPLDHLPIDQIIALAVALEKNSDHHIALELKRRGKTHAIEPAAVTDIRIEPNGVSGRIDGHTVKIGSLEFIGPEISAAAQQTLMKGPPSEAIQSSVYMSLDGRLCALLVFGDDIREGARETVERLKEWGYALAVVSGDDRDATRRLSESLGIATVAGSLLPEEKAVFLQKQRELGRKVAMVGDGVNDAPAMAAADLAIAIHSGSHLGRELADITLMRGEPRQILDFLHLAHKTNRKVLQNLWFSFLYNFISIPLAMSGLLNPLVAVCAMLLSSLTVTTNTLVLVRSASAVIPASTIFPPERDSLDHPRN